MPHDDFAFEPVRGLPERPPEGEVILWQGAPDIWTLARSVYKLDWVGIYFAVVVLWRGSAGWLEAGAAGALAYAIPYLGLGVAAAVILSVLAWVAARSTVYTVTNRRVAMRIGAALTVTINLPYRQIESAQLDLRKNGTGTIAFDTLGETKFSYLVLWPHLRPGHVRKTQPALRCIPDAQRVASLIAESAETRLAEPVLERRFDAVAAE